MISTDFDTWLLDFHDEKIFSVYRRKTIFTPYEQDKKFSDETVWEQVTNAAKIVEAIILPNNDVMLGFRDVWYDDVRDDDGNQINMPIEENSFIDYYPLSEIKLTDISEEF